MFNDDSLMIMHNLDVIGLKKFLLEEKQKTSEDLIECILKGGSIQADHDKNYYKGRLEMIKEVLGRFNP